MRHEDVAFAGQRSLGIDLERTAAALKVVPARLAFQDPEEMTRHLAKVRRDILLRTPPCQQWDGYSEDPDDPPWPEERVKAKWQVQTKRNKRRALRGAVVLAVLSGGEWTSTGAVAGAVGDAAPRRTGKTLYRLFKLGLASRVVKREWVVGMGWKKIVARPYYRINAAGRKWLAEHGAGVSAVAITEPTDG